MVGWSGAGEALDSCLPQCLQGVGVSVFLVHVSVFVAAGGFSARPLISWDFLVGAATTYPFAAAIAYGGRRLARTDLSPEYYGRIRAWFLAGFVGFLALNLVMIATWSAGSVYDNLAWALFAASVGGAVGLGIGLLEAHRIRQAVRADRQRQRRRETEARNERLAEFAESVAHDLRNPLNVAAGNLELARREPSDRYFENVEAAHDRMGTLIDQSLKLARSGREIDETERIELGSFAERCWSNVPTKNARLEVVSSATVEADPDRLKQLLENLFRNAVEHSSTSPRSDAREDAVEHGSAGPHPRDSESAADSAAEGSDDEAVLYRGAASSTPPEAPDGEIGGTTDPDPDGEPAADSRLTVSVGPLPDGAGFYVADDGPGIPESERSKVLESGYSKGDGGSGLGLAIVTRIAEAHGWRVAVTESDTGGARFEFRVAEVE